MSLVASGGYGGGFPGSTALIQSAEATVGWGGSFWGGYQWTYAGIDSTSTDTGNTPNTVLRPGLLMGVVAATGLYKPYSSTASDGTNVAKAILTVEVNMLDPFTNAVAPRWVGYMICGGPVKNSVIIGLDGQARSQMRGRFMFDDDFVGRQWPFIQCVPKTANYTCVATDSGTLFIAESAGSITFTLPAIADGISIWFLNENNQTLIINSTEGSNIIGTNSVSLSTVDFRTGSQKIGAFVNVSSVYDGTNLKWLVQNLNYGCTLSAS